MGELHFNYQLNVVEYYLVLVSLLHLIVVKKRGNDYSYLCLFLLAVPQSLVWSPTLLVREEASLLP